jgi:uncharacterized protein (DUF58 family)
MLLRYAWLPLGLALIMGGLAGASGPIVALGVFLLLAAGLARTWARLSLDRVEFDRLLPERYAFSGERLRMTYRLTNRKAVPLPWVEVRDHLPEPLAPPEAHVSPSGSPRMGLYTRNTHLGWYERASWSLELHCPERGYYRLGPARLRSGDGFGLFTNQREEGATTGVVVYPRTLSLSDLGLPAARPLGERKGHQRIFEDPLRIAGVRDYRPGDPIRRIDWKATARRGELQSRVYEPSTTHHLIVALNVDTLEHSWLGYIPELLEASIIVAASVARWAYDARYAVGLLASGSLPGSDRPINIAPGRAPDQLARILEALGGIGPMTVTPLGAVLERESRRLPLGSTLAIVTGLMVDPLAAVLRRLHDSGQQVVVLAMVDDDWTELLGEVQVKRVGRLAFVAREGPAAQFTSSKS